MDLEKKAKIDSISKSFCAAKWTQVTIHLGNGYNHSCHHPGLHKISIEEIKNNPSALHNTRYKLERRREMMEGIRPKECDYCWRVEDSNEKNVSDRYLKSFESWSFPYIDDIIADPLNEKFNPKYVEVSFSNQCNFKCSYCAPYVSSKWQEEIKKYGPYPTSKKFNSINHLTEEIIPNNSYNPYIDVWWKWFPDLVKNLLYLRVTGGEPFLNKNTIILLEKIIENPQKELTLSLNSNFCVPEKNINRILELLKYINDNKLVKNIELYTSCEAYGEKAEYIRWGLNYETWKNTVRFFNENLRNIKIIIMSTFNLLSISSYVDFLRDVLILKKSFKEESHLLIDTPYLRYPTHQTAWLYDRDLAEKYIDDIDDYFSENLADFSEKKFFAYEYTKFKRVVNLIKSEWNRENYDQMYLEDKKDFIRFVDEHDRRRGSNFLKTFPEMETFYNRYKEKL
ncbi:MAG: twitch domain-containing radical SAM protein [Candidatus Dojkabacteria bacterium]|nr:twitch domain-containing radical SAM protein [Candidatus Dojkabacteria bacterium]